MDYTVVKAAMRSIGQPVTDGPDWSASDSSLFRDFSQFTLGINYADATGVLQFPLNFPDAWAKINELAGSEEPEPAEPEQESFVQTFEAPEPLATTDDPEIAPETAPVEPANQAASDETQSNDSNEE